MYEYGADEVAFFNPLSFKNLIDKLLVTISKRKLLEKPNDLV